MNTAIGLFQVRQLEAGFRDGRMGLRAGLGVLGHRDVHGRRRSWSSISRSRRSTCGRLEARACVANGRGNGALRKLGAVQEGVLRRSFLKNGQFLDQMLWSILADEWRRGQGRVGPWPRPLSSSPQNCKVARAVALE